MDARTATLGSVVKIVLIRVSALGSDAFQFSIERGKDLKHTGYAV